MRNGTGPREPGQPQPAAQAAHSRIRDLSDAVPEAGPRGWAARQGPAPSKPRALLVYPELPPSYWDFRYALELLGKRATMPPLGLLTVAAMFPESWGLRLVDMNVDRLKDEDLEWADLVLTSTMVAQQRSLRDVLARCKDIGKPAVVGGPHPTSCPAEIGGADYILLGEVEETFPRFLLDWQAGVAGPVYRSQARPEITITPVPRFDLIDHEVYRSMALQFSRGCPFDCEFCDITQLYGRVPRTKTNAQMLAELDRLYELGWRGSVFVVDDNFIGNRREAMRLLPAVASWQRERGYPFEIYTEASVDLAKHETLMNGMVDAGFTMVFLGIESPNPEALRRTRKLQNTVRGEDDYLLRAVRRIQDKGLEVTGGFVLGLDGDGREVFDAQIDFVERAAIPIAMVGLLTAFRGSHLYTRLEHEGRLLDESTGNNVEIALNFEPELGREVLIEGYRRVLSALYGPRLESYFARCRTLLARLGPRPRGNRRPTRAEVTGFLRSIWLQLFSRQGPAYAKFLAWVVLTHPSQFPEAAAMTIKGWHLQRFTQQMLSTHAFRAAALEAYARLEALSEGTTTTSPQVQVAVRRQVRQARRRLRRLHRRLRPEFRKMLVPDWEWIETALGELPHEVVGLDLVRRWTPRFRDCFAGAAWRRALQWSGYAPAQLEACADRALTVALAPIVEQGRLRRALERLLRELGVRLETTHDQLALLGEAGLAKIAALGEPEARLSEYLRAIAQRVDVLVVPLTEGSDAVGDYVQVLATRAAQLPRLVCVGLNGGRRELRHRLIELGTALTGDAVRAEVACERACVLI
jgi:radical SAM superfamily enzyme YgiQ (UPF0313 family)